MKRIALLAGTLFSILLLPIPRTEAANETVIYSFSNVLGTDGMLPHAGLIDAKGMFYGTTTYGGLGNYDAGALYAFDRKTGAETVLYSFGNGTDGRYPRSGLINVQGALYGTTSLGGVGSCSEGCGTVFAFNPTTGAEAVVYSFMGGTDGNSPTAGLIAVPSPTDAKEMLYGTTFVGGSGNCGTGVGNGCGTVFSLDLKTGAETVLHTFQNDGVDGNNPLAGLIELDGKLYGTTTMGGYPGAGCGSDGCGTVFSIDPNTGTETVVYTFQGGTDGADPEGGLINVKGTLYGTTTYGGDDKDCTGYYSGCGTVFVLNPSTGAENVLYAFTGDGSPTAALLHVNGKLYGTTSGTGCCGTVFSFDLKTGVETLLYTCRGHPDCEYPTSPLINVKGTLYSTSVQGGTYDAGALFSITP